MEGSTNGEGSRLITNEKMPSPPTQLQPTGSVPSIFLGPANSHNNVVPLGDNCSSNNQTTQTAAWTSTAEGQRVRSPPNVGGTPDLYKMKTCVSTQCGNGGAYEGLASAIPISGGCQPSFQSRMYPSHMQQQQQIAMPVRSLHQPHHHHGVSGQCNPHHAQQPGTATAISIAPHLDRMMQGGSSAVAVAAAQQMRSMVMSHYPSASTGYPQPHLSSGPAASGYYSQAVNTGTGNGPFMDYSHTQHHHPNGQGISAAAAAAVQYAHQQQRIATSTAAAASLNPYRHISVHHQQKMINTSQAAAAYQSAYQQHQHQYNQYLHHHHHHHSMVPSHPPHTTTGMVHQRLLGIPLTNIQQQQQQQAYTNRTGQPVPHIYQHPHNHVYSAMCQPPPLMSTYTGAAQHAQPQQQPTAQHLGNAIVSPGTTSACSNNSQSGPLLDVNNNKTTDSSSSDIPRTKVISKKHVSAESPIHRSHQSSSTKLGSIKVRVSSPDKPIRIKTTKSVTKLRDRPPRLVVGQKKKSVGNISGSSSSRKLKSLKALSAAVSSGVATIDVDNLYSCSKRLPSSAVIEVEGGDVKKCKKTVKTDSVADPVIYNADPADSLLSTLESSDNAKINSDRVPEIEPMRDADRLPADTNNNNNCNNYFMGEQNTKNIDEYVPTPEEMRRYLERLNTCNNLHIPLFYAYSVFHGKLTKNKVAVHSTSGNSNNSTAGISEGTYKTTTIACSAATAIPYPFSYYHHCYLHQLQTANVCASVCCNNNSFNSITNLNDINNNNNDWNTSALSAADLEWNNFQNDMAVLEAYFPLVSTMDQSERAEKLDTIYTYEGQLKLMNAPAPPVTTATCVPVTGSDSISTPCTCVPDTTSCSCCYNYMPGMMMTTLATPQQCVTLNETAACRNTSFVDESSPPQYGLDPGFQPQTSYMSTPLSSRRGYMGSVPYDTGNNYYCKPEGNSGGGTKPRPAARKRSSSYPSRKSGRRSSGSRDHLKSETESFLDELISTAKEEKVSKERNNSGDIAAPEIQCQVDFPSLESSVAVTYSKRLAKKGKHDGNLSGREEYVASSSTGSEESESGNTSVCSSSSQSPHNISSDDNFDGGSEITPVDSGRRPDDFPSSKTGHPLIMPSPCGHYDPGSETCFTGPEHLWDDFRGDEVVTMQAESFETPCVPVTNFTPVISHCTCRRPDAVCPTRPPPGFEHLARPAFPIELYDPSLLGTLIGGQLPREVLASLETAASKKQFEEMEELLQSLTCCEKHAVDKMLNSRRSSLSSSDDTEEETDEDDWDTLEKAIKTVLSDWTEELDFRKRMQGILFTLNLHDVFGGCCKRFIPFEQPVVEPEHTNSVFSSSLSLTSANPFTPINDQLTTNFHRSGVKL